MIITIVAFFVQGLILYALRAIGFNIPYVNSVAWIIVLLTSLVFLIAIPFKYDGKYYDFTTIGILYLGYAARLVLMWWDIYYRQVFNLVHSGGDSESFYFAASQMYLGMVDAAHFNNFQQFVFQVFSIFGLHRILAQYTNFLLAMCAIFVTYEIIKKYNVHPNAARIALFIALFFPNFAILNVILLREIQIVTAIIVSFYLFTIWFDNGNILALVASFLTLMIGAYFHAGIPGLIVGYLVIMALYNRKQQRFVITKNTIVLGLIGFLIFFLATVIFPDQFDVFLGRDLEDHLAFAGHVYNDDGAGFAVMLETPWPYLDFIVNTPLRIIYLVISPMVWDWRGVNDIISSILSGVFYLLFWILILQTVMRKKDIHNRNVLIMTMIFTLFGLFVYAWGVRNAGTAMRHRDKFLLLHVIMLAVCFDRRVNIKLSANTIIRDIRRGGF